MITPFEPMRTREQVKALATKLSGWALNTEVDGYINEWLEADAALRAEVDGSAIAIGHLKQTADDLQAENERLKDEVSTWLKRENEAQVQLVTMTQERDKWNDNHRIMCRVEHELREQLAARTTERDDYVEKYIAMTQKRDAAVERGQMVLNHSQKGWTRLRTVEQERDDWNKKHLSLCHVVIELREQLAARTTERDAAERGEHAGILKVQEIEARLMESEKAAYDVTGTIEALKQQLAAVTAERDELRAFAEELMRKFSATQGMIDDIIVNDETKPSAIEMCRPSTYDPDSHKRGSRS